MDVQKKKKEFVILQHGETGAALPRALARQRGKEVCQAHNAGSPRWINAYTGKPIDRSGTFTVESRSAKKRVVAPQRSGSAAD